METVAQIHSDKKLRLLINLIIIYLYIITSFLMSYFLTNQHFKTSFFYCSVVLLAVFFASLAEHTNNKILFSFFMFCSFFVLFFIYGFRNYSAIDDSSYIGIFEQVSHFGWWEYFKTSTMEPGYLILNQIVNFFTDNYLYMQLTASFIPLFLFYCGFNKYKKMISLPMAVFLLSTMLYYQMVAVALVRMFIAMGIVLIALRYIPKLKPLKYISLIALATIFHYSSFFMVFLAYFAINKDNLTKKVSRTYTILFLTSPFLFAFVGRFIVPLLGRRYQSYGTIDSISFSVSTFTTIPLIILLLFFRKKFKDREQLYFKLFIFIYSLSIVISVFGGMVSLGRLVFYSYVAFMLGAAMVSKNIRYSSSKVIFTSIIIFYAFLYLFHTQFANDLHVPFLYPYENIFFKL